MAVQGCDCRLHLNIHNLPHRLERLAPPQRCHHRQACDYPAVGSDLREQAPPAPLSDFPQALLGRPYAFAGENRVLSLTKLVPHQVKAQEVKRALCCVGHWSLGLTSVNISPLSLTPGLHMKRSQSSLSPAWLTLRVAAPDWCFLCLRRAQTKIVLLKKSSQQGEDGE